MTKRRSVLDGSWSGAYRYPNDAMPQTTFTAHLHEMDGSLFGMSQEPNVLSLTPFEAFLTADLEGARTEHTVKFSKRYRHPVLHKDVLSYEGVANDTLTRVEGTWSGLGGWSGTFFITRDDNGEEAAVEMATERSETAP